MCSGGHGLSIGSVGGRSDNTVSDITFSNNEVKNSVNGEDASPFTNKHQSNHGLGIRIKATEGDTGTISGVTYKQITLQTISKYV